MKSETAKLPKGHSYPLKPSVLEKVLQDAEVDIDTHLIRSPGDCFDATFWPPNENVPYERLYIRIGTVSSEQAAIARLRMEEAVLPALVGWIGEILSLDARSPIRREQQSMSIRPI